MERLYAESDSHLPRAADRQDQGQIGAAQLKKMKRTVRLINTSRAGHRREALAERSPRGDRRRRARRHETEPPAKDHRSQGENALTRTCRLDRGGAGKVAVDIAEQFVDYFKNGVVRNSTNLAASRIRA